MSPCDIFGEDSYKEYTGEKFEVAWEDGENALMRVYTKDLKTQGTRIRRERQEYPNKRFDEAIDEKLPMSSRCARCLKMPMQLVNREELGKLTGYERWRGDLIYQQLRIYTQGISYKKNPLSLP